MKNPEAITLNAFLNDRQEKQYWFSGIWGLEWLGDKYKGLNHVVARDIIEGIKAGEISLDFAKAENETPKEQTIKIKDATDFAKTLIQYKVSIPALIAAMREGNLSFSGQCFYKFLDQLYKGYVMEPGLFTDEIMFRMEVLKLLPYDGKRNAFGDDIHYTSEEEDNYLLNPDTPLEIVDALIQKPYGMEFKDYSGFINLLFRDPDSQRKTEIILLAIKNLANYQIAYSDEKEVEEPKGYDDVAAEFRNSQAEDSQDESEDQDKPEDKVDPKIKSALARAGLCGTKYEAKVVSKMKSFQDKDKSTQSEYLNYFIYKARKDAKEKITEGIKSLREELLAEGQELPKPIAKEVLDKFKTIAASGRCRRMVKKIIMSELKKDDNAAKFTDARKAVAGYQNLDSIAKMVASTDPEFFTIIGQIMSETISEIESEHNFNPNLWNGTIRRGWNKFASYPVGAFFAVLDFFSMIFEYVCEYTKRAAFKSYEAVRGWLGYDVKARENQEILGRKNVEGVLGSLKEVLAAQNKVTVKEIPLDLKEQLRNAIIDYLAVEDNGNGVSADASLKAAIVELCTQLEAAGSNSDASSKKTESELQKALAKLNVADVKLGDHKKDLQAILEMPEMHRGISDALPGWSNYAKSIEVLSLVRSSQP